MCILVSRRAVLGLLFSGAILTAGATDGIAVSAHGPDACQLYSGAGDIIRYDIKNDVVASQKVIFQGCGMTATFNKKGDRVAFIQGNNCAKGSCPEWIMKTMTIDGADVRTVMNMSGASTGRLAWTTDNWIYYFSGSTLRRVNPDNPSQNESVVTFSAGNAGWWGMDAFGKRMSLHATINSASFHVRYTLPGNGQITASSPDQVGTGCNNIIAPSGSLFCWTVDAGHSALLNRTWESTAKWDGTATWENYNSWATDKSMQMTCTGTDAPVTVGNGFEGNRWSSNSDKWVCLGLGWPPNGRFYACGSNQVLVNWQDQKTIMVSYNPRAQCKSTPDLCTQHVTTTRLYNEAGDFWVTSPESEIIPELRAGAVAVGSLRPRAAADAVHSAGSVLFDIRGKCIPATGHPATPGVAPAGIRIFRTVPTGVPAVACVEK